MAFFNKMWQHCTHAKKKNLMGLHDVEGRACSEACKLHVRERGLGVALRVFIVVWCVCLFLKKVFSFPTQVAESDTTGEIT